MNNSEGKDRRPVIWALTMVIIVALIFAWAKVHDTTPDDPQAQTMLFRKQAEPLLMAECTNRIVGLSRIIDFHISDYLQSPNQWTADVTAEFVNKVGGIERTNAPFKYSLDSSFNGEVELHCQFDWRKAFDEQKRLEAIQRKVDAEFDYKSARAH